MLGWPQNDLDAMAKKRISTPAGNRTSVIHLVAVSVRFLLAKWWKSDYHVIYPTMFMFLFLSWPAQDDPSSWNEDGQKSVTARWSTYLSFGSSECFAFYSIHVLISTMVESTQTTRLLSGQWWLSTKGGWRYLLYSTAELVYRTPLLPIALCILIFSKRPHFSCSLSVRSDKLQRLSVLNKCSATNLVSKTGVLIVLLMDSEASAWRQLEIQVFFSGWRILTPVFLDTL